MSDLNKVMDGSSNDDDDQSSGSAHKTQMVFWDKPQLKDYSFGAEDLAEAYRLAEGNGKLRNTFADAHIDEDHQWENIHHFVAEILVGVDSLIFEGSSADVMDTLMLDAEDIGEYLDQQPEVKAELVQALNEQHGSKAEADD